MNRELVSVRKQNIRFLTIVERLTDSQIQTGAVNYALGYQAFGMDSAVLAFGGSGPLVASLDSAGVPVFTGGETDELRSNAIAQARRWEPDILHVSRPGHADAVSASVVSSFLNPGVRSLETNACGQVDDSRGHLLFDLHLHLSNWALSGWLRGCAGIDRLPPAVVVPHAVNAQQFVPLPVEQRRRMRAELGLTDHSVVFGRLPRQGRLPSLLRQSFRATAERFPEAWLLVFEDPAVIIPELRKLPGQARNRVKNVPFPQTPREIQRYYGCLDVLCHVPSADEISGLYLCEAMLNELPILTINTPFHDNAQIEIIEHGTSGLLASDAHQYKSAMMILSGNEDLRQFLGRNGSMRVRSRYELQLITSELIDLARLCLTAASGIELAQAVLARRGEIPKDTRRYLMQRAGVIPSPGYSLLGTFASGGLTRRAFRILRTFARRTRRR
jgi:glycosyltransferase involved in cell wall biosynthesis